MTINFLSRYFNIVSEMFAALLFWLIGLIIKALSLEHASTIFGQIWRIFAPFFYRHKRALAQIKQVFPELTVVQCEAIARESWENLGRTFAESFHLKTLAASDRIMLEETPDMVKMIAHHGGRVLCAPHIGNWEVSALAALKLNLNACGVYQRIKNPRVDAMVSHARAPYYPAGLFSKGYCTVRAVLRHARNGGALLIMADQRDNRGLTVPFLDLPAPSTPFPAYCARTQNAALFVARVKRLPRVRFLIRVDEIVVPHTDKQDEDILTATAAIQAKMADYVRETPGQWMWAHRRWQK